MCGSVVGSDGVRSCLCQGTSVCSLLHCFFISDNRVVRPSRFREAWVMVTPAYIMLRLLVGNHVLDSLRRLLCDATMW